MKSTSTSLMLLLAGAAVASAATSIEITFTSTGPVGFAPIAAFFHTNRVPLFTPGAAASSALETLAEVGNPGPLLGTAPAGANSGTNGAPFGAGSSISFVVSVDDINTSFSYAAMLLPSNDWFIGNSMERDITALLNAANGTSLMFDVSTVWDAGTELEDFAFSAGNPLFGIPAGDAGAGTAQNGVVSALSGSNPFGTFASQPVGFDSSSLNFSGGPVGTFTLTVVPEPSTSLLGVAGVLGLLARRRRC